MERCILHPEEVNYPPAKILLLIDMLALRQKEGKSQTVGQSEEVIHSYTHRPSSARCSRHIPHHNNRPA